MTRSCDGSVSEYVYRALVMDGNLRAWGGVNSVSRPRHKHGEYERFITEMEGKGWNATGGGNSHYKVKCPGKCLCVMIISTTPRSRSGTFAIMQRQRTNKTCWED